MGTIIDALALLRDTPLPTVLAVAGLAFVFLALVGRVGRAVVVPESRQKLVGSVGLSFLILGIGIYLLPLLSMPPPQPDHTLASAEPPHASTATLGDNSTTPENGPPINDWVVPYTYEFPTDWSWSPGQHSYTITLDCPGSARDITATRQFTVTEGAPFTSSTVYLRPEGAFLSELLPLPAFQVHPSQSTVAVVTLIGLQSLEAQYLSSRVCAGQVAWDAGLQSALTAGDPYQVLEDILP